MELVLFFKKWMNYKAIGSGTKLRETPDNRNSSRIRSYDTISLLIMLKFMSVCSFLIKSTTHLITHAVFTSRVMVLTGLKVFQVLHYPDQINFRDHLME